MGLAQIETTIKFDAIWIGVKHDFLFKFSTWKKLVGPRKRIQKEELDGVSKVEPFVY